MRIAVFLLCVFAGIASAFAQDQPTPAPWNQPVPPPGHGEVHPLPAIATPAPPVPVPRPAPAPRAAIAVAPRPAVPAPPTRASQGPTARLEHLLEAAVHLESAGESGQAQEVRRLVAQERGVLMGRMHDVAPRTSDKQVMIEVQVLELARDRMKKLGLDMTFLREDETVGQARPAWFSVLQDPAALTAVLDALRKDKLVRVLAEPTLVGVSGRPMSFQSGGEYPVKQASGEVEFGEYGVRADFVPRLLESGNLRLDMKMGITELLEPIPDKPTPPKTRTRSIDTGVEMKPGQTCVISGMTHQLGKVGDDSAETMETLYLVTPKVLD